MFPVLTLVKICLFAAKPQDLPASRQLLTLSIAGALVILFICYSALPGQRLVLPLTIAHVAAIGLGWMLILRFNSRMERWTQSATALFGCSSIISIVQLPLVLSFANQVIENPQQASGSTAMMVTAMWIWEVSVISVIIRDTLEVKRLTSVILSIGFTFAIQLLLVQVFGQSR